VDIKHILVATDFSDDAKAAVEAAIDFTKVFSAKLQLLHAYHVDVPAVYGGFGGDFVVPQDILEPIRQAAQASMEDLIKEVAAKGVAVEGKVVMEHAARAILEEAERLPADLLVTGTRGLTGLKHVVLGSTAERMVRLAPCPVLTIKSGS
jgi:nucleotide-binding universal stress UspA family protein